MRKLAIVCILFLFVIIQQNAFAKENTIYEMNINKANDKISVNLISDFKEEIKAVKENEGSVYFDIKNARLDDNFKTNYNQTDEPVSVVSQQIGSKVRIYLKGNDIDYLQAAFVANKGLQPVDFNKMWLLGAFAAFVSFVALKSYSATIRLSSDDMRIKNPMNTAINLNRQLYEFKTVRKKPELVLNSTNPVKSSVYVDFSKAKERQNTKVAI